MVYLSDQNMKL